jgi:hypothetical protein
VHFVGVLFVDPTIVVYEVEQKFIKIFNNDARFDIHVSKQQTSQRNESFTYDIFIHTYRSAKRRNVCNSLAYLLIYRQIKTLAVYLFGNFFISTLS